MQISKNYKWILEHNQKVLVDNANVKSKNLNEGKAGCSFIQSVVKCLQRFGSNKLSQGNY